jgi:hypothetical protein
MIKLKCKPITPPSTGPGAGPSGLMLSENHGMNFEV